LEYVSHSTEPRLPRRRLAEVKQNA
jgi:hypothetical protein